MNTAPGESAASPERMTPHMLYAAAVEALQKSGRYRSDAYYVQQPLSLSSETTGRPDNTPGVAVMSDGYTNNTRHWDYGETDWGAEPTQQAALLDAGKAVISVRLFTKDNKRAPVWYNLFRPSDIREGSIPIGTILYGDGYDIPPLSMEGRDPDQPIVVRRAEEGDNYTSTIIDSPANDPQLMQVYQAAQQAIAKPIRYETGLPGLYSPTPLTEQGSVDALRSTVDDHAGRLLAALASLTGTAEDAQATRMRLSQHMQGREEGPLTHNLTASTEHIDLALRALTQSITGFETYARQLTTRYAAPGEDTAPAPIVDVAHDLLHTLADPAHEHAGVMPGNSHLLVRTYPSPNHEDERLTPKTAEEIIAAADEQTSLLRSLGIDMAQTVYSTTTNEKGETVITSITKHIPGERLIPASYGRQWAGKAPEHGEELARVAAAIYKYAAYILDKKPKYFLGGIGWPIHWRVTPEGTAVYINGYPIIKRFDNAEDRSSYLVDILYSTQMWAQYVRPWSAAVDLRSTQRRLVHAFNKYEEQFRNQSG